MSNKSVDLVIVGAGILGLAHAYHAAKKGLKVVVLEQDSQARGASVRNFGILIADFLGSYDEQRNAIYGENTWMHLANQAGFEIRQCGALLVAQFEEEMAVLREFAVKRKGDRQPKILEVSELKNYSRITNCQNLLGGLWLPNVKKINQRLAADKIIAWLGSEFAVDTQFNTQVIKIDAPRIETNQGSWQTDHVIVCPGNNFRSLYSRHFEEVGITSCQLQMMRTVPQLSVALNEPCILGGLSYARYAAFQDCKGIKQMKRVLESTYPGHIKHGIHVIVAQEFDHSFTLGDSHHYGDDIPPGRLSNVDALILDYARTLVCLSNFDIEARWLGQYAWLSGKKHIRLKPAPGVELVTITNGQGMTMSFSLAKEVIESTFN